MIGKLDERAIEDSLNRLIERHESLRTGIIAVNGEGLPDHLSRYAPKSNGCRIVSKLPAVEREISLRALTSAEAQRPFDLAKAPLLRATLCRITSQESVLVLSLHQIICDGWSMQVLLSEFATIYEAYAADRPAALPPLGFQFADFAAWQRGALDSAAIERHAGFWKRRFAKSSAGAYASLGPSAAACPGLSRQPHRDAGLRSDDRGIESAKRA